MNKTKNKKQLIPPKTPEAETYLELVVFLVDGKIQSPPIPKSERETKPGIKRPPIKK